jgi:hypothetical protein
MFSAVFNKRALNKQRDESNRRTGAFNNEDVAFLRRDWIEITNKWYEIKKSQSPLLDLWSVAVQRSLNRCVWVL